MPMVGRTLAVFIVSVVMMSISIDRCVTSFCTTEYPPGLGWDDALMVAALE